MLFYNPYPPSSDIGLHGSIINLILDEGTLPTWNPYHMGGEQLATPPGFHFFVSILILFTGMSVILAELITAAFFSSIIVFPAYIVAKRMWRNQSAGLLAAFFASISALSIEMISWGGYTNIVSLFLIVSIFYLFLRDVNKPTLKHLLMGTIIFGALIITHTFSLSVFLPILALYLVLLTAGKIGKLKEMRILSMLRFFVVSVTLGIVAVSPWILRVFNFYISASSSGALTGGLDNREVILASRTVEPIMLSLIVVIVPTLIMLKHSRKRYLDSSSLLLIAWFLVPVVMTQAYIFGIYTDYSRFMYFIDFPGIIIISASLLYLSRLSTFGINRYATNKLHKIKKALPVIAATIITFIFIIASLWSIFPHEGMKRVNFYSTIEQPEYTSLEWIRNNTPEDSILVADHLYGWWLSGLAERPTLSAAGLEFLIYSHELEVAKNAQLLLDTDYSIDNGFIQIRDDGPYVSRHNPEFGIQDWTGSYWGLLYFQNNKTIIDYNSQSLNLTEMLVTENSIVIDESLVVLTTTYESDLFTVKKKLQLKQGVRSAQLCFDIKSSQVEVFNVSFTLNTTADLPLDKISNVTIGRIGAYNWYHQVAGQVILEPNSHITCNENTTYAEITYNTQNSSIEIEMLVNVFDSEGIPYEHEKKRDIVDKFIENTMEDQLEKMVPDSDPITTWKYTDMIEEFNVSYVVCRDKNVYMKFSKDPKFRAVFNCGNVSVFQVTK
jgi:hypothetical protein